jgi:hypothetical protein
MARLFQHSGQQTLKKERPTDKLAGRFPFISSYVASKMCCHTK